jgi:hypothetical protein
MLDVEETVEPVDRQQAASGGLGDQIDSAAAGAGLLHALAYPTGKLEVAQ